MKHKSNMSLSTAQQLINTKDETYLTTSIHCCYYAVLQMMKYVLSKTDHRPGPIPLEKQNKEQDKSSHEYILDEIRKRLNRSSKEERDFVEGIRYLKNLRVQADYSKREFTLDECLDCKQDADSLLSKIKQYFGDL